MKNNTDKEKIIKENNEDKDKKVIEKPIKEKDTSKKVIEKPIKENDASKKAVKTIKKKKTKKKKINKQAIVTALILMIFIIYTILVKLNVFLKLDEMTESFIIGIRNDKLTGFMETITNLGGGYALVSTTIVIILVAIIKNKRLPLHTMTNLACIYALNTLLKIIIRRPRPTGEILVHASGYSYPSGHAIVSLVFYTFIAISMCERIKNIGLKVTIRIALFILPLVIAFSRIYLGVHYLTDIIGAYILGFAYLRIFLYIRKQNILKKEENKE